MRIVPPPGMPLGTFFYTTNLETAMQGELFPLPVAATVRRTLSGYTGDAAIIMNRNIPIPRDFVERLLRGHFAYDVRLNADRVRTTRIPDLDLLSFLVALRSRRSVIEIPTYSRLRVQTVRANERRVGSGRYGHVTGLVGNKHTWAFSVCIDDVGVITSGAPHGTERIGAPRNYTVQDPNGTWYHGWKSIVVRPTEHDLAFFTACGMLDGDTITFQYFVHPNRRQSIYGAPYLLLKMLTKRLEDEARFLRREIKRLAARGFTRATKVPAVPTKRIGAEERTSVVTMEMVLDIPPFAGAYPTYPDTQDGMNRVCDRLREITYTLLPLIRFVTRADEYAYFTYGLNTHYKAPWMQEECVWTPGYRTSAKSKIRWHRMVLTSYAALRYHVGTVVDRRATS